MKQIIYTAYFVDDPQALLNAVLVQLEGDDVKTYAHHLTKAFRPSDGLSGVSIGRKHTLQVYAQVVRSDIQAVLVKAHDDQPLSINAFPHITIATKNGVAPSESNRAIEEAYGAGTVQPFPSPIFIQATEGYFDGEDVHTADKTESV